MASLHPSVLVGERIAPDELALVQAFVNTNDREGGHDVLGAPADAADWLVRAGVAPRRLRLSADDVARIVALREAIRELARVAHEDDGGAERASQQLAAALAGFPLVVRVAHGRLVLGGEDPVAAAVAPIVDALRTAMDRPDRWSRLKICDRDRCRWMFYDASRNNASRWCRTDLCGSREKARRAYARRRAGGAAPG